MYGIWYDHTPARRALAAESRVVAAQIQRTRAGDGGKSHDSLLERLRYVCILSSNLDEFFEIRISSLKEQQRQSPNLVGPDGMTPDQAFDNVQRAVHELVTRQYALLNDEILPAMQAEGIALHHASEWNPQQQEWAHEVFIRDVMPLLTPIGLDPAHPFPRVYNKSLNFIVSLSGADAFGRQASIAVVRRARCRA